MKHKTAVILFFKYPQPGRVKKRLSRQIGKNKAACIYRGLAEAIYNAAVKSRIPVHVFYSPAAAGEELFKQWLGPGVYMPQQGKGLGARMENAFRRIFNKGYSKAMIMGGDIQNITPEYFILTSKLLDTNDVVLGPAMDGGYYLIGFNRETFLQSVFREIKWSTQGVLEKTMDKITKYGLKAAFLPAMCDADTAEDLGM